MVNQPGSRLEENVSEDLQAGNSAEFSKPQIPLPDREFESVPLRQLVLCFSGEISLSEIIAQVPQVSPTKIGATGPRERRLEEGGDFGLANSLFGNSAVRLATRRPSHRSNGTCFV